VKLHSFERNDLKNGLQTDCFVHSIIRDFLARWWFNALVAWHHTQIRLREISMRIASKSSSIHEFGLKSQSDVICAKGTRFDKPIEIMEMRTQRDKRGAETKGTSGAGGKGRGEGRGEETRSRQERCKLP